MSLDTYIVGSVLVLIAFLLAHIVYYLPQLRADKTRARVRSRAKMGSAESVGVEFHYNGKYFHLLGVEANHRDIDNDSTDIWFTPKRVRLCSTHKLSVWRVAKICFLRSFYLLAALSVPISMGYIG